ncbi:MAG: 16S rRNA processing protein RimM [Clostridia bacterium]|nr:16S rRNA processing protein RimM [Clostridia bacterium]
MAELIEIGKIVNTHGLKGEVKIVPWLDYPEVFEAFDVVYTENQKASYKVKSVKYQKTNIIVKFEGLDNINEAEKLKNKTLYVEKSLFDDLPEGTYLIADIIGLEVFEDGVSFGKVTDVFSTGSNDIYVVEKKGEKPLLLPIIDGVLEEVNIEEGYVNVRIPAGLLDI